MFSFFKNWRNKDSSDQVTEADLREEIKEESVLPVRDGSVEADQAETSSADLSASQATPLSLHELWESELSTNQKYALSFMAMELPPIAPGTVSLAGIKLFPHELGVEVTAFIRNGTSRPLRMGKMNLAILIGDGQLFARQSFDLAEVGEIPAGHARPWSFIFERENFLITNVMLENWKIAFETAEPKMVLPQQLELDESWIKVLSDEQKEALVQLAKRLPELRQGEVNVQSVQANRLEDGSYRVMLLFRNGSNKPLEFKQLPLVLQDAKGEIVAQGLFELDGFTVNPGTSKPWMFVFPAESVVNSQPDMSRWKVALPSKK